VRIGGTMEFSGINNRLDRRRIDAIVAGARETLMPWETPAIEDEWAGMRPITADGLPILDRARPFENAYIATGYAMFFSGLLMLGARLGDRFGHRHGQYGSCDPCRQRRQHCFRARRDHRRQSGFQPE